MRLGFLPVLLLIVPIMEIGVFILVGGQIGVFPTLAMILVTAILGSILLRVQGLAAFSQIMTRSERGEVPGKELVTGVMIIVAGILLLTPGFVTDTLGFLLFFPPFRSFLWTTLISRITVRTVPPGSFDGGNPHDSAHKRPDENVVDLDPSEFSEKPNPDSPWKNVR